MRSRFVFLQNELKEKAKLEEDKEKEEGKRHRSKKTQIEREQCFAPGIVAIAHPSVASVKCALVQTHKKALNASMMHKLLLYTLVYSGWACDRLDSVGKIMLESGVW